MPDNEYPPSWNTQAEEAPERDYPAAWTRPEHRVSPSTSDADNPASRDAPLSEDDRGQQLLDHAYRLTGRPELADRSAHPFTIN